ncbi:energy transducer TonB [Chryseobacterium polytrichastri]|uniref:TonB protein C-terminal n=1 Tax=Chryseobacterium polytrichastri TaxID=1302687 RepID=A0A1M7BNS3_9FLAO|nr:energy transducer TonB [Chryseobacterium polytrichastri]SHL56506.1 TonB protein C-terminal [Chryseobacterium polytrichastri]
MKKILFFLSIILGSHVFGQESVKGTEELNELILEKSSEKKFPDVEKSAEFPKGLNVFKQMLATNVRGKKIIGDENMSCELVFIIDKAGSIIDIKATGNNQSFNEEVIRAASKIKEKWIPAEINGQKVRYRFRVPLTMSFDK